MLREHRYPAEGIRSVGDKRVRLTIINPVIKAGQIFFPRYGAETLIQQLIGFGIERHDDLADAFAILIGEIIKNNPSRSFGENAQKMIEMNGWDREDREVPTLYKDY